MAPEPTPPRGRTWILPALVFLLFVVQVVWLWSMFVAVEERPSERIGAKPVWFLVAWLAFALALEIGTRVISARNGTKLDPERWPGFLLLAAFAATLLLFVVAFPMIDLSYLLYTGRFSWGWAGLLLGLPAAVVLGFMALGRTSGTDCLTTILAITICPIVLIAFLLGIGLWDAFSSLGESLEMRAGEVALLLAAVVACAALLFAGAKRLGKRPGPPKDQE